MSKEMIRVLGAMKGWGQALQTICEQEIKKLEGSEASEETTTKSSKGKKSAPADDMEEVESPYKEEKTKGKKAPAKEEVAEEVASDDDDMFGDDAAEEDTGPTLDDVRKVVKDFATKHGKEKALKLLGKFKVTSIPDIKKADYAKVIELAKKHL
jgi:hypothetical protein